MKPMSVAKTRTGIFTRKLTVAGRLARSLLLALSLVRAWSLPRSENTSKATLDSFVRSTVADDVSLVATDDAPGYQDLKPDYPHESVNHSGHEYVRGLVHTSSIDSFWSLLKRGIMGQFHHVSKGYLPLYV